MATKGRIPRAPARTPAQIASARQSLAALSESPVKTKPKRKPTVVEMPHGRTVELPDDPEERRAALEGAADALLADPAAIAALEAAGMALLEPSNDRRGQIAGMIETKIFQRQGARYVARARHLVVNGRSYHVLEGVHPYNTAQARAFNPVLAHLFEVPVSFEEDPHDASRFADRKQTQPARHTFGREKRSLPR